MGTKERRERERRMRRVEIQNVAKRLFLEKGYGGTTMEDIAFESELSLGTIYKYFNGKDDLYASLSLITLEYLKNKIGDVYSDEALSVENKMIGIKEALYDTYVFDPMILRNILHVQLEDTLSGISEDLLEKLNNLGQKIMSLIADVYRQGVEQGKFIEGHGMEQADIVWSMFTGIVVWVGAKGRMNQKKEFIKTTIDRAFDIFLRGIIKN